MNPAQQKEAAKNFAKQWQQRIAQGEVIERSHCQQFWNDLLDHVLGVPNNVETRNFEKRVNLPGNKNWIDLYLPGVRVLIEQKTPGERLDGVYEQAKRYDDALPVHEKAQWIITCNFQVMRIYDQTQQPLGVKYTEIPITPEEFPKHLAKLEILRDPDLKRLYEEQEVSTEAGHLVALLKEKIRTQYQEPDSPENLHPLSILLVRIVFCLYAEDAGLFQKDQFSRYMQMYRTDAREALRKLFRQLSTPEEQRDFYEEKELKGKLGATFPYADGGLFEESITIPDIPPEVADLIYNECGFQFDWSPISPTIFGALFESTLNPEMRREGGMHYTSIQNIHRVIRPLFLDELWGELRAARGITDHHKRLQACNDIRDRLASIRILDPACGSGNFLTESFIQLRRIENEVLKELNELNGGKGKTANLAPMVSVDQFYGLEINPFAVEVARVALWIAQMQMLDETQEKIGKPFEHLPLHDYNNIHQANALTTPWADVVSPERLTYIIGNPPFSGSQQMGRDQKAELKRTLGAEWPHAGSLDYVAGWFKLASDYMRGTTIRAALVSTNSVCQGEQATYLWEPLMGDGLHIDFAWPTFNWTSELKDTAAVHVVIVGFSYEGSPQGCRIFNTEGGQPDCTEGFMAPASRPQRINQYLGATCFAPTFIKERETPITVGMPTCTKGSMPIDNGHLTKITPFERERLLAKHPEATRWVRSYLMGEDFIHARERYCLWLVDALPAEIAAIPAIKKRVGQVKAFRAKSKSPITVKMADIPSLFVANRQPVSPYLAIPESSTERRDYIPMGFLEPETIAGNTLYTIVGATRYHFGILTSGVHMAWVRTICGRLKSDYRYASTLVYNNFPWPEPTKAQRTKIEKTAQAILEAREKSAGSTLAHLYDKDLMPLNLRRAHEANDRAVLAAYGWDAKLSEPEIVERLMGLYQQLTSGDSE